MDKLIVIVLALVLIAGIAWWFFGKRKSTLVAARREGNKQVVEITVDGGYKPGVVELQQNVPAELVFLRKDPSGCYEEVVFPDFGVHTKLPVGQPHVVAITPEKAGEFTYACGMNMFFGKVIVK